MDGRQLILRVGKDGVALLIAGSPAAGRLSDTDLARLRRLLISEQFRREVAREAALPKPEQACSDGAPLLVAVGLRRLPVRNQPGYLITVDQAGRGSIAEPGEPVRSVILTENQQDVLRMLEPLLSEGPVPPCNSPEHYRLHIGGGEIRPDCSFRGRYPEFRALVSLLEDAFAR